MPLAAAFFSLQLTAGSLVLLVVIVFAFWLERRHRIRMWQRIMVAGEAQFDRLYEKLSDDARLMSEKLDGHLRLLVLTDGKAKESIAAVEASLHRLELMETRVTAHDHRLAIIERAQEMVLDVAHRLERESRDRQER